jgi:adenosylcobinamide-phosphate synthase
MAGALGVRLGGRNVYFGRSEVRPFLGDGPRPEFRHITRAVKLSSAVGLAALGVAAAASLARPRGAGAALVRRLAAPVRRAAGPSRAGAGR